MSYSDPFPDTYVPSPNDTNPAETMQKIKIYQAFIFSVPICVTVIFLFFFYVLYLRQRNSSVDWSFLGMRGGGGFVSTNTLSTAELGLNKELREMLPIVIYKESLSINDSSCSVCLGDYQADEKLQQIPACGHTFHMECIDLWLTSHTTCPLCRLSLIPKSSLERSHQRAEIVSSMENSNEGTATEPEPQSTTEEVSHVDDGQEGDRDSSEVFKETEENDPNSVGTSNDCCNSRLG